MMRTNLVDVAKGYLSEDIVNKFSSYVGESPQKTRMAFDEAIPSVFSGLIHRATDKATARSIGDLLVSSGPGERRVLEDFSGAISTTAGTELLTLRGEGLLSVIFGGTLGSAIDAVSRSSGVNRGAADKILALSAPLVTAVVSREASSRKLDASQATAMLSSQKESVGRAFEQVHRRVTETVPVRPTRVWHRVGAGVPMLLLGAVALIALFVYLRGRSQPMHAASMPDLSRTSEVTITGADMPAPVRMPVHTPAATAGMKTTSLTLEGFDRENRVAAEGKSALDELATELKSHPQARVKIDGFSDDGSISATALRMSVDRANLVKQMLIERGVDSSRITSTGYGSERPVSRNDTSKGRAENRRVEISVY